ncbi:MAG: hypothetical protein ACYDEN_08210 [Acidimicrobiales bacterium]
MVDLADAGRRLAAWEAGEPTAHTTLAARARRRTLRRRARLGVAALAATAAAVAGTLLVPGGTATPVYVGPGAPSPFPAVPLPPAPAGWARTAIGTLDLAAPGASVGGSSTGLLAGISVCLTNLCESSHTPSAGDPVIVTSLRTAPTGTIRVIAGLTVDVSGHGQYGRYQVPALGVQLATYGALGRRIAATMAPSPALVVASATSAPAVPTTWRTVHYGEVTVSVPPTWPVVHLSGLPAQPHDATVGPLKKQDRQFACELFFHPVLDLGDPPGSCGADYVQGPSSPPGLWLGQSYVTPNPGLTETRLRWVTAADVELGWYRLDLSYLAELTIRTPNGVVRGTVGLGADPVTIERVLASIRVGK